MAEQNRGSDFYLRQQLTPESTCFHQDQDPRNHGENCRSYPERCGGGTMDEIYENTPDYALKAPAPFRDTEIYSNDEFFNSQQQSLITHDGYIGHDPASDILDDTNIINNDVYDDTMGSDLPPGAEAINYSNEEPGQEQNCITDYPYNDRIVNEDEAVNGDNIDIDIDNNLSPLPDEEIQGSSQHEDLENQFIPDLSFPQFGNVPHGDGKPRLYQYETQGTSDDLYTPRLVVTGKSFPGDKSSSERNSNRRVQEPESKQASQYASIKKKSKTACSYSCSSFK